MLNSIPFHSFVAADIKSFFLSLPTEIHKRKRLIGSIQAALIYQNLLLGGILCTLWAVKKIPFLLELNFIFRENESDVLHSAVLTQYASLEIPLTV